MAPYQIKKIQKIIDKNITKRYPFLTLNSQSCRWQLYILKISNKKANCIILTLVTRE